LSDYVVIGEENNWKPIRAVVSYASELPTVGRERKLLDWLFDKKAEHPELITTAKRRRYVACYAKPCGMSQGFAYYRAAAQSATQNVEFGKQKLPMPILALGGSGGMGDNLKAMMEPLAEHVEAGAVEDCGHYVMEEWPADWQETEEERYAGVANCLCTACGSLGVTVPCLDEAMRFFEDTIGAKLLWRRADCLTRHEELRCAAAALGELLRVAI
jgi:hypothetical protein